MEVSDADYTAFYQAKRRQKYLVERAVEHRDVSLDALLSEGIQGEGILRDPTQDVVQQVENDILLDKLRRCLPLLSGDEQKLIYLRFYRNMSEPALAGIYGITLRNG